MEIAIEAKAETEGRWKTPGPRVTAQLTVDD
jgi:hypothetical protein